MMGDWMALMVASVVGAALAWGLLLLRPSSDAAIDELYDTEVVERCVMAHLMSDPRWIENQARTLDMLKRCRDVGVAMKVLDQGRFGES